MMSNQRPTLNAPHLCLVKAGYDYDLYIMVPYADGKTVVFSTPTYRNNQTEIKGTIQSKEGSNGGYYAQVFKLENTNNLGTAIQVTVTDEQHNDRTTTLLYSDAPANGPLQDWINNEIAYNCPYLYLDSTTGLGKVKQYEPSCIVHILNQRFVDEGLATDPPNSGDCVQRIFIEAENYMQEDISHKLRVNQNSFNYTDQSNPQGSFEALVYIKASENPPRLRAMEAPLQDLLHYVDRTQKGKIRNISSD